MAIVFISAKEKQRSFFTGLLLLLVLVVAGGALALFLPGFLNPPQTPNSLTAPQFTGLPPVSINFSVLDSDKVKNLQPFLAEPQEFSMPVGRSDPFVSY